MTLRDLHADIAAGDADLFDEPIVGWDPGDAYDTWVDEPRLAHERATVIIPLFPEDDDTDGPHDRLTDNAYTASQVCNLPPHTSLVNGVFFTPGESVIYSPPKKGKTFFGIDFGLSVASGQQFMGRDVQKGPVVFVAAEGVGGLGARVQAWHDWHQRAEYVDDITFVTVAVNLMDPKAVLGLCAFLKARGVVLTIIDTLARCTAGAEENSARDMGRVVEALDQIRDATAGHVCVIHHAGKDVTKGMRGSSALLGAVDTVVELVGASDAIRVTVTDQKDTEPVKAWWCHLEPAGASAVIEQTSGRGVLTATDRKILAALEALAPEHRTASRWRDQAAADDVPETTFYRRIKVLQEDGKVAGGGGRGALYTLVEGDEE